MSRELCDWLNRAGLIIGFISFWFAAPELIGEPRLKAWEAALAAGLRLMPRALKITFTLLNLVIIMFYLFRFFATFRTIRAFPLVPNSWVLTVALFAAASLLSQR